MGRVAAALATTLIAACYIRPDGPRARGGEDDDDDAGTSSDDATTDGPDVDTPGSDSCPALTFSETDLACGMWANATTTSGATITRNGTVLDMRLAADQLSTATCTEKMATSFTGIEVEIVKIPTSAAGEANVTLAFPSDTLRIQFQGGNPSSAVSAYTSGGALSLGMVILPTYVRVLPATATAVVVSFGDGSVWPTEQMVGIAGSLATARLTLEGKLVQTGPPGFEFVDYDNLDLCR